MSSPPAPRVDRATRRAQLLDAAADAFRERGVAAASVDDIVRRAGVAKGTFYLYFASKEEAMHAVVERMVDGVVDRVAEAVEAPGLSPVRRLRSLGRSVLELGGEPFELELVELFHRPENRAVHERMAERIGARLAPLVERVVAAGIEAGAFREQDPRLAAWCVLGAFEAVERDGAEHADRAAIAARVAEVEAFVLRGLGHRSAAEGAPGDDAADGTDADADAGAGPARAGGPS